MTLLLTPSAHFFDLLRGYFQRYGYWTVVGALLLENLGVPVPGETTLLFASFLAYSEHQLSLPLIIFLGVIAAVTGDNLGYAVGHFGGRRFVEKYLHLVHIRRETIQEGEHFFRRHGAPTVFFARFIAGLRVVAGPLAGTLKMPWRKFLLFNFLGAAVWVTVIACIGYFFGYRLGRLVFLMGRANLVIAAIAIAGIAFWWWKRKSNRSIETPTDIHDKAA